MFNNSGGHRLRDKTNSTDQSSLPDTHHQRLSVQSFRGKAVVPPVFLNSAPNTATTDCHSLMPSWFLCWHHRLTSPLSGVQERERRHRKNFHEEIVEKKMGNSWAGEMGYYEDRESFSFSSATFSYSKQSFPNSLSTFWFLQQKIWCTGKHSHPILPP